MKNEGSFVSDDMISGPTGRELALDRVLARPLWDENDLAIIFDVAIDTIRHMKVRGEIPAVIQVNQRCWRVHRDAFLEHFKQEGMPTKRRGRPRGSTQHQ